MYSGKIAVPPGGGGIHKIENIPAIIICCVVVLRNIVQFLKDYIFNYPAEELHFEDGLLNRNTSNRKDN
jgi:hypothetical protein